MGNDISSSITPPPLSLQDCTIDGELDLLRYSIYRKRIKKKVLQNSLLQQFVKRKKEDDPFSIASTPKKRKYNPKERTIKKRKLMIRNADGTLRPFEPTDTIWYKLYIEQPPTDKHMLTLFRQRFRLTYNSYVELLNDIKQHNIFCQWVNCDMCGSQPSNIDLLLLGTLRYLGRAWTFDDVNEATAISREVVRSFFHKFILYGSTILYDKHVRNPALTTDLNEFGHLFTAAGFSGCIGSTDATHVGMLSCANWATHNHLGHKLSVPSRTYNVTVSHCRQILHSTVGHPATWNDKTIILYDNFVRGVRDGEIFSEHEFTLFEKDENNEIIEVKYKGIWFMVDNGYLSWSCTVPPFKDGVTYEYIRFSEWLESMRKDVECTFGIMKGRFSILRYGLRVHSIKKCDEIWLTCCALHNRLLFIDGLHKNWEIGGKSYWENEDKVHKKRKSIFALQRLYSNNTSEGTHDNEEFNYCKNSNSFDKYVVDGKRIVRKMPLHRFQDRLVHHFDIRFKMKKIVWPVRIKQPSAI